MKNLILITLLIYFVGNLNASPQDIQELDIEELFVIEQGYDSNDDIELTVHGALPNACFKLHEAKSNRIGTNSFEIKVSMKKKNLSGCESALIETPVSFSQTISLGELDPGKYNFSYSVKGNIKQKYMNIKSADVSTIDEQLYAPISSAFIPELIYTTNNAHVVLTGIFYSNCFELKAENVEVIRNNNVFIILPKANYSQYKKCKNKMYPIQQIVNLGPIKTKGHYLVHIRSLSGLSVNRVFHVEEKALNSRGSL